MKISKKVVKNKKKNKKKSKKIIKNNIDIVSEKISFILDKADLKYIRNITTAIGPKVALRLCNQTSDIEETGGLNDPNTPNKKLTKLESFLYLIENDSTISDTKKSLIKNPQTLPSSANPPKLNKKKRKSIKRKVGTIQNELNRLCLTQVKAQMNSKRANYFAIESLNKFDDQQSFTISKSNNYIKPSTFNLNLNDGMPKISKNYSNSLISKPKLNLDQINFNSNSVMKNGFQLNDNSNQLNSSNNLNGNGFSTNNQSSSQSSNGQNFQSTINQSVHTNITQVNRIFAPQINIQLNLNKTNIQNNWFSINNNQTKLDESKPNQFSVASLLNN